MTIKTYTFEQLSNESLYDLLALRSKVFVMEQNCLYEDIDYRDQEAVHCLGYVNSDLAAYTRIFEPDNTGHSSIGRVLTDMNHRKMGYGKEIMIFSINYCLKHFGNKPIKISAQTYLNKFYTELGFVNSGEEYLEDGIPHINMVYIKM